MGIEPTYPAWKAGVLPLNYTRVISDTNDIISYYFYFCKYFFYFFYCFFFIAILNQNVYHVTYR